MLQYRVSQHEAIACELLSVRLVYSALKVWVDEHGQCQAWHSG